MVSLISWLELLMILKLPSLLMRQELAVVPQDKVFGNIMVEKQTMLPLVKECKSLVSSLNKMV